MPSKLEKMLGNFLADRLQEFGFLPVDVLSFIRCIDDLKQIINAGGRHENRKLKFTCILGVRFEQIESILRPNENDDSYPTVCCPIHLIAPERKYYEWEGGNEEELAIAADSMIAELHEVGFDYFDRFSTLEAVEEELTSSPVSDSFLLSADQRTGILAAIAMTRGDRAVAEQLFAEAIKDRYFEHPARKRRLEELRTRVLGD